MKYVAEQATVQEFILDKKTLITCQLVETTVPSRECCCRVVIAGQYNYEVQTYTQRTVTFQNERTNDCNR